MTTPQHGQPAEQIETLSRSLAETYEELNFIYRLNSAMNLTADPIEYLRDLVEDLRELLGVKGVIVLLSRDGAFPAGRDTTVIATEGMAQTPETVAQLVERRTGDRTAKLNRKARIIQAANDPGGPDGQMLVVPILRGDRHFGLVVAFEPVVARTFNNIDLARLSSVTNGVAVFLENFRLYHNLHQLFIGSLRALTSSIDAKDPYTCGHSERVARIAKKIVTAMNLPANEIDRVYLCGLLHDIGKIGMPEAVLAKPGKPTPEEFEIIKRHPTQGADILVVIQEMEDIIPAVRHHHERFDGKGYPDGLVGSQIPFRARVLGVADTLDAMTSNRPYRNSLSTEAAVAELINGAGTQFDPAVVEVLLRLDVARVVGEVRERHNETAADPAGPNAPIELTEVAAP